MSTMTGDEYMQLLTGRQADWVTAHPKREHWAATPLLESFVLPGDETLFTPPVASRKSLPVKDKTAYPRQMVANFTKKSPVSKQRFRPTRRRRPVAITPTQQQ